MMKCKLQVAAAVQGWRPLNYMTGCNASFVSSASIYGPFSDQETCICGLFFPVACRLRFKY